MGSRRQAVFGAVVAVVCLAFTPGCGSILESIFGAGEEDVPGGDGGGPAFGPIGAEDGGDSKPCVGLCLKQVACEGGGTTSLTGVVRDPAGATPLYNVLVFVPNAPVEPIKSGASCERCGDVSGDPLVAALTDTSGAFRLENVPVDSEIPLVVQIGKWRRQLKVTPKRCDNVELAVDQTRLPKNKEEGDIPKIALTTGGADTLECFLRKIGVEDKEFTKAGEAGRVHLYAGGNDGSDRFASGPSFERAADFWNSKDKLATYDMVILSCEGNIVAAEKPPEALAAMKAYADMGGRVFASHWHRYWFYDGPQNQATRPNTSPFPEFAKWEDRDGPAGDNGTIAVTIDTTFPKGQAFSDWMSKQGALSGPNQFPLKESRDNVDTLDGAKAQQWITVQNPNEQNHTAIQYLTANTPIEAAEDKKCGRLVFSDLHVSANDTPKRPWPSGCKNEPLSAQEKALEFLLFDLSSCVQSDKKAPTIPGGGPR